MWNRAELKAIGKINFKMMYKQAVIVCIIFYLVGMLFGGGENSTNGGLDNTITYNYETEIDDGGIIIDDIENNTYANIASGEDINFYFGFLTNSVVSKLFDNLINVIKSSFSGISASILLFLTLCMIIINGIFYTFIVHPITIGKNSFFMGIREGERKVGDMFFLYEKSKFIKPSITMFFVDVYILLWSFLFIIPGVVKSYEYRMIQYILAENHQIDRSRAFEISKVMMNGQKMDTFILDLSFIGWDILSMITFGLLGVFYINPYRESTYAELYGVLRKNVIENGFANENELPGFEL